VKVQVETKANPSKVEGPSNHFNVFYVELVDFLIEFPSEGVIPLVHIRFDEKSDTFFFGGSFFLK